MFPGMKANCIMTLCYCPGNVTRSLQNRAIPELHVVGMADVPVGWVRASYSYVRGSSSYKYGLTFGRFVRSWYL